MGSETPKEKDDYRFERSIVSIAERFVSKPRLMGTIKENAPVLPKYRDIKTSLLPRIKLFNTFLFTTCRLFMNRSERFVTPVMFLNVESFGHRRLPSSAGDETPLGHYLNKLVLETIKRRTF